MLPAAALLLLFATALATSTPCVVVSRLNMTVCGKYDTDGVRSFYSIPFGAPTVRWQKPTAWVPSSENTTINGTVIPNSCPTTSPASGVTMSEDCLYLNIWAPDNATSAPVILFIYGGGFFNGYSAASTYIGELFAGATSALVITANYRTGAFGFLALQELYNESGTTGNYGMLDQQLALKWVQDNVAYFGGDPTRVLLMGESAGGKSVVAHLLAPSSSGLFAAVAAESPSTPREERNLTYAVGLGNKFIAKMNCSGLPNASAVLSCIRSVPMATVIAADTGASTVNRTWTPVVDGYFLETSYLTSMRTGKVNRVPLIIGTNFNEGTSSVYKTVTSAVNSTQYLKAMMDVFPQFSEEWVAKVVAQYPPTTETGDNRRQIANAYGDYWYYCATRLSTHLLSKYIEVHSYIFAPILACTSGSYVYSTYGTFHGSELMYMFGHAFPGCSISAEADKNLSRSMRHYWLNLAGGNANSDLSDGRIFWPAYNSTKQLMVFNSSSLYLSTTNYRDSYCDWWYNVDEEMYGSSSDHSDVLHSSVKVSSVLPTAESSSIAAKSVTSSATAVSSAKPSISSTKAESSTAPAASSVHTSSHSASPVASSNGEHVSSSSFVKPADKESSGTDKSHAAGITISVSILAACLGAMLA